ncbi:MAG: proline dehydrogenase family protein [Gemmatimonadota bacterium]|nr:proline dehydrogenase family protein [Gemmatimonadota bacterium]
MELLRRALLWASTNPTMAHSLPRRTFVRRAVRRFMPGEKLGDALREAGTLDGRGISTIVTMLGENLETAEQTHAIVDEYVGAMEVAEQRGLDLEISIKPTHLGLDQDPALVLENAARLAARAEGHGTLWIDMEGSAYVEPTLDLYRQLKRRHANVGLCLQSYLRRTPADLEELLDLAPRIRLVKGAYAEPAEIAFPDKSDVDAKFRELADTLLQHFASGGDGFVGFGTHDPALIDWLAARTDELGTARERIEFEMLYGIGVRDQDRLVAAGRPLRVLISYGSAWFPWYMRRLAERPANIWFVVRSVVR